MHIFIHKVAHSSRAQVWPDTAWVGGAGAQGRFFYRVLMKYGFCPMDTGAVCYEKYSN